MWFTALNSLKSRAVAVKHGITNRANRNGEPLDLTVLFQHLCKADYLLPNVTLLRYQSWFHTKARILVLCQPFLPVVTVIKHIKGFSAIINVMCNLPKCFPDIQTEFYLHFCKTEQQCRSLFHQPWVLK